MILTCPACDTKYVVKDDAIPPGGRQVRCASCKHSWHQEPEGAVVEAESASVDFSAPPTEEGEEPIVEIPQEAAEQGMIAGEPQPEMEAAEETPWGVPAEEPPTEQVEPVAEETAMEEKAPAAANEWRRTVMAEPAAPGAEEEFASYAPIAEDDDGPRRRWPLILLVLALIVAAAAAFWFFAPPEWKERAGIAAGGGQLQLKITMSERQPLESGNELVVLGGRITNPTNREQRVPPIQAKLRDPQSNAIVHQWVIDPPKNVLAPGESASFNSAELDQPREGDQLLDVRF